MNSYIDFFQLFLFYM